jgi:hypothetical protein
MKQTTEVSENQTPEACSSLPGVSMHQARASPIPTWYYVYVRPRGTMQNFLTVLCRFWHSVSMRKIYPRLLRVQPILPPLGHILSVPIRSMHFQNANKL